MRPFCFLKPALLLAVAALGGCSIFHPSAEKPPMLAAGELPPVVLPAKVTAIGYGALPGQEGLSQEQRRLMAIRASKLDAYRSLAETIAGLKITSSTTVSAVSISNDSFRVYVEAYLRGARVLTVTPMPGGSYETVLELVLGGDFYRDTVSALQGQPVSPPPVIPAPEAAKPVTPAAATGKSNNYYLAL